MKPRTSRAHPGLTFETIPAISEALAALSRRVKQHPTMALRPLAVSTFSIIHCIRSACPAVNTFMQLRAP